MSRSNPTAAPAVNPCTRWFQWDSTTKQFKYYDKEAVNSKDASKKGDNIFVRLPFKFIVLDVLNTIAGFSDEEQSSFYSNEIRSIKDEIFDVKLKGKTALKGNWESIKDRAESIGAKFANSIYIGFFNENKELQLGNIKFYGAPIGAWINATTNAKKAGKKVEECAFKVASTKEGKKGSVKWNEPVFELIDIKEDTNKKAIELDVILQEYLKSYFKQKSSFDSNQEVEEVNKISTEQIADDAPEVVTGTFDDEDF